MRISAEHYDASSPECADVEVVAGTPIPPSPCVPPSPSGPVHTGKVDATAPFSRTVDLGML